MQIEVIKSALAEAKEDGFPTDVEEKEAYFLQHIAQGEALVDQGKSTFFFFFPFNLLSSLSILEGWDG